MRFPPCARTLSPPPCGPPCAQPRHAGPPCAGPPKISLFFFLLSPALIFALFVSPWVSYRWILGGVFEGRDPQMCTFGLSDCRVKPLRLWFRRSPSPQVQGVGLCGFGLVGFRKLGKNSKTLNLAKVSSSPQSAKVGQRAGQSRFGQSRSSPKLAKVGQRAGQSRFGQSQHDHNNTPTDTHQLTPRHTHTQTQTHAPTHTHTQTHTHTII